MVLNPVQRNTVRPAPQPEQPILTTRRSQESHLGDLGVATGLDLDAVLHAAAVVEKAVGPR